MKRIVIALFAGALLVSSGIAAKNNNDNQAKEPFTNGPANESQLEQDVRHQLVMLPYYTVFDDLAFNVNGGTVTLLGEVTNPVTKTNAASAVKKVEGVTKVVNNIQVLPLSTMDWQIRRAEYRAIYGAPGIGMRYGYQALPSIHIIVKNGNVRLVGVVANQMDKNLINIRANTVPNVFHVTNELRVEGKPVS